MQQRRNEIFEDGVCVSSVVVPWTWEEIRDLRAPLLEYADVQINKAMDAIMAQGADSALAAAWCGYRQQLRDITINFATPDGVEWPAVPGSE